MEFSFIELKISNKLNNPLISVFCPDNLLINFIKISLNLSPVNKKAFPMQSQ